jgi:hypothetical protein
MPAPYEKTVQVSAESGQSNHFPIPFIYRGQLKRILVKQLDGVLAGYVFDIFNSKQPMQDFSLSSMSGADAEQPPDNEAFKVLPTQAVASGHATYENFTETGDGYDFKNVDSTTANPARFLYLHLNPAGTGTKNFQVTLVGKPPL